MEKIDGQISHKERVDEERYKELERKMKKLWKRYRKVKEENAGVGVTTERSSIKMKSMGVNCSIDRSSRSLAQNLQKSTSKAGKREEQVNEVTSLQIASMPSHQSQMVPDHQSTSQDPESQQQFS